MLVAIEAPEVVGPTTSFGELAGRLASGYRLAADRARRHPDHARTTSTRADHPRRRSCSPAAPGVMPLANVGDTLGRSRRGDRRLLRSATPSTRTERARRSTTTACSARSPRPPRANQLAIASMNVENLDPLDPQAKFDAAGRDRRGQPPQPGHPGRRGDPGQQRRSPPNADIDRRVGDLRAVHRRRSPPQGGPTYEYRQIDPGQRPDGGEPPGNIRVGFLFRTDRGRRVRRPPGRHGDERDGRRRHPQGRRG